MSAKAVAGFYVNKSCAEDMLFMARYDSHRTEGENTYDTKMQ